MLPHGELPFLKEILLFLTLAGVLIPLLQRLKINEVLGFLAIGMLLGPFGLGAAVQYHEWLQYITFTRIDGVIALAEFGVLFLMFRIGLELSIERLWHMRPWVFGAGLAQLVITSTIIGLIAYQFDNTVEDAVLLGIMFSFSSTAIATQLLVQERMLVTPLGRACFSILLLQDLALIPLLVFTRALSEHATKDEFLILVLIALIKAVVVVTLIYGLGRLIVRPVFRYFAEFHRADIFMALILLSAIGISALTSSVGLSMALGAFLVGLLLSETEYRHEIEITIEPFKGLFMGLFFMAIGMSIDWSDVVDEPFWFPLSVLGLLLIKSLVVAFILRMGKFPWARAIEGGCLLAQGGEFAFIVIGVTILTGVLPQNIGQFMLLVTGASMLAAPLYAKMGSVIRHKLMRKDMVESTKKLTQQTLDQHIIIAGFGRVGQMLAGMLTSQQIPYVAIEYDAAVVDKFFSAGYPIYYGDASKMALLKKLNIQKSAAVVLTMNNMFSATNAVVAIQREYPHLPVIARTHDEYQALALKAAGVDIIIPETFEASLQLGEKVLSVLGLPDDVVSDVMTKSKESLYKKFEDVRELGLVDENGRS